MMMGKTIRWGLACALTVCCSSAAAQGKEIWEEYGKRVTSSATVSALGPDLFGDQVSMSNGALSFSATDVSLPGNSALPVAFTRTFSVRNSVGPHLHNDFPMQDWEIDLPNISGTFAGAWLSGAAATPYKRCSVTDAGAARPPYITFDSTVFEPKDYWQGHTLSLPTGGGELLLLPSGQARPSTGGPYFWITADQTRLSCLPSIQNWSGGGEGFLATAPDGTRYWFDWMGSTIEDALLSKTGKPLARARVALYPTRVEDRFGNRVDYTYTNSRGAPVRLTRIRANDGRQIDIAYNTAHGAVSSVTTGTRSWQYQYATLANSVDHTLSAVIQPDGSRWGISFAGLISANVQYMKDTTADGSWRSCTKQPFVEDPKTFHGSMTHPSGASGEFTVEVTRQGRTNVPALCDNVTSPVNDVTDDVAIFPIYHHALSLTKKRITGPGMDPMEWNYAYNAMYSFYYPGNATAEFPVCTGNIDCSIPVCTSDACAGSSTTKVTDSNGDWIRHTYGTSYRYNEGKLLSVEVGTGASTVLRKTVNTYDLSQLDRAYPARWGISPRMNWEGFPSYFHRPQLSRTIHQDGASFSRTTNSFDHFARPLSVSRADPRYSRTDATQYHDNLSKWVLGQVSRSSTNGIVTQETGYDAVTAAPVWSKAFGKLQHTLGYHADGTLATVKDGRNLITTLSNWYRGVPRSIQHADSTAESAVVDASGWITRVTDENGFQTNYTYDAMGRMASIVYPAADTVAWNATTQAFAQVGSSEYGIPAGHWRQTISTGNGRKQTYFDALWRPVVTREYDAGNVTATQRFTRLAYDAKGRAAFASYPGTTDALTKGTYTTYDALDRVTSVAQNSELGVLNTSTAYLAGFQTRTTNPRGKSTLTTIYQAYDEPSYDLPRGINHPEGAFTEIFRDVFGKPTAVKRRNLDNSITATRWYVYGADQQLCKVIEPETGSTVTDYDAAGNVAWSASGLTSLTSTTACNRTEGYNSGRRVDRSYDARNRVSTLSFPDGLGDTSHTYTPDGQLASITVQNDGANQVATQYTYNKRRLPTSERMLWGSINWPIHYSYNANGHQSAQVWQGVTVDYAPNALGQPTKAGVWASGVSYFPNGAIKQFTYGNGIVHTLTQNARQLPDTSRDAYGTTKYLDDGYDYDGNGNVAAISDGLATARGDRTMSYDGLDRLTATTSPMYGATGAAYSYDVLDNLKSVKAPGRDHTYIYDANKRLTNVTNTATGTTVVGLGYDVQGNLANKNGQTFAFDYGNRLRSVSGGGGTYVYDGHGRRVRDTTTADKFSHYSQGGQLMFTVNARDTMQKWSVYLAGSLVAIRERNYGTGAVAMKYQHTDALGSPVAVTDASRNVVERSEYEPYGKRLASSTPAVKDGIGYTGHVEDAATGMTYMQQRYYDPGIGRFLSVDPVTADGSTGANFNRYWYANNNPYRFTDPDGRQPRCHPNCGASFVGDGMEGVRVYSGENIRKNRPVPDRVNPSWSIEGEKRTGSVIAENNTTEAVEWFRPWSDQTSEYYAGRVEHPIVSPGNPISKFIEHCVPAGRRFARIHDAKVDKMRAQGKSDLRANFPTMPVAYWQAFNQEGANSLQAFANWLAEIAGVPSAP